MKRSLLRVIFILLVFACVCAFRKPYDTVILHGRIIDPATHTDQIANIGIRNQRIAIITTQPITGHTVINADKLIVTPGFIDVVTHKYTTATVEKYKVLDGVTTAVYSHDGVYYPRDYFRQQQQRLHRINYATFVNGAFISIKGQRQPLQHLQHGLNDGAIGIAATPEYVTTTYAQLLKLAKLANKNHVPLFLHLRYSSRSDELKGIEEAIQLARQSGAAIHIMHIHSTGATYAARRAMHKISAARQQGLRITADVYPYTYWLTGLASRRFDNFKQKYGLTYSDLTIGGTEQRLSRQSFKHYRKRRVYVAVPPGTIPFHALKIALKQPFVIIASDGQIMREHKPNAHPRGAGTFAQAFKVGQRIGLKLPVIVNKVTYAPAQLFAKASAQFEQRGCLAVGCYADIAIFDPEKLDNQATLYQPAQATTGMRWVLVNGEIVVRKGHLEKVYAGVAIKKGS